MIGPHCLAVWLSLLCCSMLQGSEADVHCTGTADVVFVLDESGSVTEPNWPKALKFTTNVISNFDVSEQATKFGLIVYSQDAAVTYTLSTDKSSILSTTSKIPYTAGGTNTAAGLHLADTKVLLESKGDRDYAPNVIILVTDGKSNINEGNTIPYAQAARKRGAAIIVVGIGSGIDMVELNAVASVINGEHQVYLVTDYAAVTAVVQSDKISNVTCTVIIIPDCQNGGKAVSGPDARYTCVCTAGFYGPLCDRPMPKCQNGGKATLQNDGSYACSCADGFYGDLCQTPIPKCQNGGKATLQKDGTYDCICPAGFYGTLCEHVEPKCQNGGTIVTGADGLHKCSCAPGFYGDVCDKPIPPCQNGGTAVLGSDGKYTCKCADKFYGTNCENPIPQCQNGGTSAIGDDGKYMCLCKDNYYGKTCENIYCQNGGTYVNGKCACPSPFYGDQCEKSPPSGYTLIVDENKKPVALISAGKKKDSWDNMSKLCDPNHPGATLAVADTAAKDTAFRNYVLALPDDDQDNCGMQYATAGIRNPVEVCDPMNNFVWKPTGKPSIPIVPGQSYNGGWKSSQPDCSGGAEEKESCIAYWNDYGDIGWNDYGCKTSPICPLCELNP